MVWPCSNYTSCGMTRRPPRCAAVRKPAAVCTLIADLTGWSSARCRTMSTRLNPVDLLGRRVAERFEAGRLVWVGANRQERRLRK
jgi:hypothetical protein